MAVHTSPTLKLWDAHPFRTLKTTIKLLQDIGVNHIKLFLGYLHNETKLKEKL